MSCLHTVEKKNNLFIKYNKNRHSININTMVNVLKTIPMFWSVFVSLLEYILIFQKVKLKMLVMLKLIVDVLFVIYNYVLSCKNMVKKIYISNRESVIRITLKNNMRNL